VNSYLREHSDLATIIPLMCDKIRGQFGAEAEMTMKINRDPEIHDPYLILCVRLPAYRADTRKCLDAIWQQFEDTLCKMSGWIILTTDFRKAGGHGV
jgi:hypothetical protein